MDFLGNCVKDSCGLVQDSGGSGGTGVTLGPNNKLLGGGDKQLGTTDNTNLEFYTNNQLRAILDSNGNFDVRDLRTSEVDILPNQQFKLVSGTATLSNYESSITTNSESDEFKVSSLFTPDQITATISEETTILINSGSASNFLCGVIDSIGNKSVCPSFSVTANDVVKINFIVTTSQLVVAPILNNVGQSGVLLTSNIDIPHSFYFTGIIGTMTIIQSKINDTELKGAINLADNHNSSLSIREDGKDYLNINTLDDTMTLQNVNSITGSSVLIDGLTDINTGSILFNDNQIVINQQLVGSQESMTPLDSIVQLSNFSSLNGEILTITADESNITLPIRPTFTIGQKFELNLNIDRQSSTPGIFYIGVGEYLTIPLNYTNPPNLVYQETFYSTATGFGGTFVAPGVWNVDPNFYAPNYNNVGIFQIKMVLEESGEFNLYIDDQIKFSMTLTGSSTYETFIWSPGSGTVEFDTAYASMLSSDGGIVIDGYPVAQTFNQLLGGDPNNGVMTFNQVNTKGIIIGDEENIPNPTTDNSLRFGAGAGTINAETLTLESEFKTSFVSSGLGAEVVKIDHLNANLDMLGYHITTDRMDVGSYQANLYSLQPTQWNTLFNATANGSLWTQNANQARGITKAYTLNTGTPRDFIYEVQTLTPHRHWIGISDSSVDQSTLAPTTQAFWFKISVEIAGEDNFYRVYTNNTTFVDEIIDTDINYSPGDKIKFEINSSNEVRLYLDTGSGFNLVSTAIYTIPSGTDFYGRITDQSLAGIPTEIDLQVTDITPDFTDKSNKINIYDGIDIQFENDMKITRENDEYINFDVTNNEIDVFKDIQSTANISCVSLTTDTALFPSVDTSKMLSIISPYTGQIVYNTEEGQGKFCYFNGTTWQVTAETWQGVNDTASTTLLKGQPVQVNQGGNNGGVIQILTNGSNAFAGIVCFQDVAATVRCAVAEHGTWEVLCDAGTYTVGNYLQTSSTGRARQTTGISSQTWAIILENVTLASPGMVLSRLRIYPP